MKKMFFLTRVILASSALFVVSYSYSQTNALSESGNVGIGTLSPSARLTVAGSARIDSTLVVNDSVNMVSSARIGEDLKVEGNLYLPNIISVDALNEEMILLSGEDGLTTKIGASALKNIVYSRNCDLLGGPISNPTWANGTNKIFSECIQVFVGIGTDSPTRNLDVFGDAKIASHLWANGSVSIGADMNTFSKLNIVNTNRTAIIQGSSVGNNKPYQRLMFFEYDNPDTKILEVINTTSGRTPFALKADGSMDIDNGTGRIFHLGTNGMLELTNGTMQTFKVETTGLVRARRMKLDLNTWADYVFDEDYQLMPLDELEAFVKKEKHLPNIPSEKDLKSEGADVMELNKMLMEKVEELTLYLIQQNKDMNELKQQVEALQVKIKDVENH